MFKTKRHADPDDSNELEQQWNSMESTVLPHNEEDD